MTANNLAFVLPDDFTLARYRLTLQALETLHLPPLKGSALRGGFGHTFKRLACTEPWPCGDRCQGGNTCPYGYVFETVPPPDTEFLRLWHNDWNDAARTTGVTRSQESTSAEPSRRSRSPIRLCWLSW